MVRSRQPRNFASILGLFLVLLGIGGVAQATTPFLYNPYYGSKTINSYFDHKYPDYTDNACVITYNSTSSTNCKAVYYDGHSGYDYAVVYEPALSAYSGSVIYSGWADTNHELSYGLEVKIDHANSHHSLYGHLSAILFATSTTVGSRVQVGTTGTTGNSSGPHLHYEVRYNQGGVYKVKDPYGWAGSDADPWKTSSGVISEVLWVASPSNTAPANNGTTTVDDLGTGFTKSCLAGTTCPYWYAATAGYSSHMWWTYSNGSATDYKARWTPTFTASGNYEFQVHIPNVNATTHAARYTVKYNGGSKVVVVDQHDVYNNGGIGYWVSLGTYNCLSGSTSCYLEVVDATYWGGYTESSTTNRQIGVDAARWIKH